MATWLKSSYSQQTASIQEAFTAHYRIIDTATWPRRDHFTLYRQFVNPSSNLCVPIAAQRPYECAKDRRVSFFQLALYVPLRVANGVPQLRQHVHNDEVIEYDNLAVMTPVMTIEEGFRQVWCGSAPEFATFSDAAMLKIVATRGITPTPLIVDDEYFICASCLPWLYFISMTHAEHAVGAAVPALTWERLQNGAVLVAGRFSYVFVDGLYASRFFVLVEEGFSDSERFQQPLTETAPSLFAPAAKER